MKNLIYTGAFRFPEGDAAARRVYSVGRLFSGLGFNVVFAGWESRENLKCYTYKGYKCFPQAEFREANVNVVSRIFGFMFRGWRTAKWLYELNEVNYIVLYNPPALFAIAILIMGKLRNIKIVLDSTEWYEGEHLPGGKYGLANMENLLRMKIVYPRFSNVICISEWLKNYYSKSNTINIPPIMDAGAKSTVKKSIKKGIYFIYAGEAGKKDRLCEFVIALPAIAKMLRVDVCLNIAGMTWAQLEALLIENDVKTLGCREYVICHGRLPNSDVVELYKRSHFSILFRENKRYAHAGFPTKAVESWCNGCPIITNKVGDIGNIAKPFIDAILIEEGRLLNDLVPALKKIVDEGLYENMEEQSIRKFKENFSYTSIKDDFFSFVKNFQ